LQHKTQIDRGKLQIPKSKFQISFKLQIQNSKHVYLLRFEIWKLFGIWKLRIGILTINALKLKILPNK